jgi:hypothetical protein
MLTSSPRRPPGTRIAQVRVIFRIEPRAASVLFGDRAPGHLAYVEWFSASNANKDPNSRMYRVSRSYKAGARLNTGERERQASVVELETVIRSCHLAPRFAQVADRSWSKDNVLERADKFLLNNFRDNHSFQTIY